MATEHGKNSGHEPRALVLAGYGINCDWETAHALNLAGARAERVHISDLTGYSGRKPDKFLEGFQILVFDGGFSWGDDHGAGVLLATRLGNHLREPLGRFLERGGLVLGICNGFQALVNLGLLPMLNGGKERSVALMANDCGNFQDRWVELLVEDESPCLFTRGMTRFELPIRHGEGKFVANGDTLARIEELNLVAVRYGNGRGKPAGGRFPMNPNGALNDIAGICDPTGRVFGLMPHPEGYFQASQHPTWTLHREKARRKKEGFDPLGPGLGMGIFMNAVSAAREAM